MIKITKYDRMLRSLLKAKRGKNGAIQCSRCGKTYPLDDCAQVHVSHFFGRANWTTRLDEENVDFHCHGCHQYLGANPHIHAEWKREQLGQEKYDALVQRARKTIKELYGMKKGVYLSEWYEQAKKELADL